MDRRSYPGSRRRLKSRLERREIRLRGLWPRVPGATTDHEHSDSRFLSRAQGFEDSEGFVRRSFGMTESVIPRPGREEPFARTTGCRAEESTLRLLEPGRGSPRREPRPLHGLTVPPVADAQVRGTPQTAGPPSPRRRTLRISSGEFIRSRGRAARYRFRSAIGINRPGTRPRTHAPSPYVALALPRPRPGRSPYARGGRRGRGWRAPRRRSRARRGCESAPWGSR